MRENATVIKRIAVCGVVVGFLALPLAAVNAQAPSPSPLFEGNTVTPAPTGASQPVHISIQSWEIASQAGATHEIPLRGFYVAHLLSGHITTTIDGQTLERDAGSFWTVKAGATMRVKVLGEFAVLETIVASKP